MDQPNQMKWLEISEKYSPINLEEEPLPADINPQDKVTTIIPTLCMGIQDPRGHIQAPDSPLLGHK